MTQDKMKRRSKEFFLQAIIGCLLFVIGLLYVVDKNEKYTLNESNYTTDVTTSGLDTLHFLRFVYIGSSGCGYCNNKETEHMVKTLKTYFRNFAHRHNYKFWSTGISVDVSSIKGINFLQKTGYFDEIISGGNWYNLGADQYVWNRFQGRGLTPQLLLTLTTYEIPYPGNGAIVKRKERLLKRFSGMNAIKKLYQQSVIAQNQQIGKELGLQEISMK